MAHVRTVRVGGLRDTEARGIAFRNELDDVAADELHVVVAQHDPPRETVRVPEHTVEVFEAQAGTDSAGDVRERIGDGVQRPERDVPSCTHRRVDDLRHPIDVPRGVDACQKRAHHVSTPETIASTTRSAVRPSTWPTTFSTTRRRSSASSSGWSSDHSIPAATSSKDSAR